MALCLPRAAAAYGRVFFCFFDENRAQLSDRCRSVIAAAAEDWRAARDGAQHSYLSPGGPPLPAVTQAAEVRGYATEAGSAQANQRLSLQRAIAVADELRRLGIPDGLLHPVAYGETEPLVPGAPHDPQNRRAWIIFRPP